MESLLIVILKNIIPVFIPPIFAGIKKIVKAIPDYLIPLIIGIAGGVIGTVNYFLHTNFPVDVTVWTAETLKGFFIALAGVGVHQIWKQLKKSS
jgi:hypothetical protein